jgi:cytochrome c556
MNIAHRIAYVTLALAAPLAACKGSSAAPDARTPVPLTAMMANHQKQEMRDHLRVVQEITAALTKDDFDAIAKSAARIGWSEREAMMCKHMGAGAPGFAEVGEHFHKTADKIGEAAKRHDRAGVTAALDATLQTCVGCHDTYRQEIVDQATFGMEAGSSGMDDGCEMMKDM